jgi:hypothetical protein
MIEATRASLAQLHDGMAKIEALRDMAPEQFNFSPGGKAWSIGGVVTHLSLTTELYTRIVTAAIKRGRRRGMLSDEESFRYSFVWRQFMRMLKPKKVRGLPAPKKMTPARDATDLDPAATIDRFKAAHDAWAALYEQSAGLDLRRVRHRSPLVPIVRQPLGVSLTVIPMHLTRHLDQIDRIRAEPGFPAAAAD